MRSAPLALIVALAAGACVTITPATRVGSVLTPPPTSTVDSATSDPPMPTPPPTADATPPSKSASPADTPARTPKPTKKPKPTPSAPQTTANPDDPACSDDAYTLEGFHWNTAYSWHYNAESTPAGYDADAVLAIIKQSFDNVINERNDCGRPDTIKIFTQYQGDLNERSCTNRPDGANTISWGKLPTDLSPDTIAYTCPFYAGPDVDIGYEADIVINEDVDWALSLDKCHFQELLEPTITHEVGHVFGLGHVSERQHPDLTMSTQSNGWCDDSSSTLGLGDMLRPGGPLRTQRGRDSLAVRRRCSSLDLPLNRARLTPRIGSCLPADAPHRKSHRQR